MKPVNLKIAIPKNTTKDRYIFVDGEYYNIGSYRAKPKPIYYGQKYHL